MCVEAEEFGAAAPDHLAGVPGFRPCADRRLSPSAQRNFTAWGAADADNDTAGPAVGAAAAAEPHIARRRPLQSMGNATANLAADSRRQPGRSGAAVALAAPPPRGPAATLDVPTSTAMLAQLQAQLDGRAAVTSGSVGVGGSGGVDGGSGGSPKTVSAAERRELSPFVTLQRLAQAEPLQVSTVERFTLPAATAPLHHQVSAAELRRDGRACPAGRCAKLTRVSSSGRSNSSGSCGCACGDSCGSRPCIDNTPQQRSWRDAGTAAATEPLPKLDGLWEESSPACMLLEPLLQLQPELNLPARLPLQPLLQLEGTRRRSAPPSPPRSAFAAAAAAAAAAGGNNGGGSLSEMDRDMHARRAASAAAAAVGGAPPSKRQRDAPAAAAADADAADADADAFAPLTRTQQQPPLLSCAAPDTGYHPSPTQTPACTASHPTSALAAATTAASALVRGPPQPVPLSPDGGLRLPQLLPPSPGGSLPQLLRAPLHCTGSAAGVSTGSIMHLREGFFQRAGDPTAFACASATDAVMAALDDGGGGGDVGGGGSRGGASVGRGSGIQRRGNSSLELLLQTLCSRGGSGDASMGMGTATAAAQATAMAGASYSLGSADFSPLLPSLLAAGGRAPSPVVPASGLTCAQTALVFGRLCGSGSGTVATATVAAATAAGQYGDGGDGSGADPLAAFGPGSDDDAPYVHQLQRILDC
mmetsp:Transcript_37671/g.111454  ORF Transcript_37671/g.111454 Transcript_37671/m.111454 type:complete len:702 (-) Transcript_37671:768-2873(-)